MRLQTARRMVLAFALANLLLLGWGLASRTAPAALRVTFLDVGQGDAAIIESPSGKVLVMDTGPIAAEGDNDAGRRVLAPYLRSQGINRLNAILLSHPHADHIGGAETLLSQFPVDLLMDNGEPTASPLETAILKTAKRRNVRYRPARRGQEIDLGDGTLVRILAPTEAAMRGPTNDASIVLRVEYGRTAFLFTGDAEANEEAEIVANRLPLSAEVLKVGHHGSLTSTTSPFLAAIHPRLAVISVGKRNLYGHPRREILQRLQESGARVYRTDRDGAVTCLSDGLTIRASDMRSSQSR